MRIVVIGGKGHIMPRYSSFAAVQDALAHPTKAVKISPRLSERV